MKTSKTSARTFRSTVVSLPRRAGRVAQGAGALSLLFLLGAGSGCVTPPGGISTVKGVEQEDIPVPRDFEFKESESLDQKNIPEGARFRSWRGTYHGIGQIGDIAPWYITQMRTRGWRYIRRDDGGGMVKLTFEKGEEVSEIAFCRKMDPAAGSYVTVINPEIHPRGPEDFTVDEHLKAFREAEIKPASFNSKEAGADTAVAPAAAPKAPAPKSSKKGGSVKDQGSSETKKSSEELELLPEERSRAVEGSDEP